MARRLLPPLLLLPLCAVLGARGQAAPMLPGVACADRAAAVATRPAPRLQRVVVIVMKNKSCDAVIGSQDAPYLNRLARRSAFAYYVDVSSSPSRCRRVVPFAQLHADLARRSLPRFVWITPDVCHDMHSCPIADGDRFLARLVPLLQRAVGPRGAIVVTWDEGADHAGCCGRASGGQIPTIVTGPAARPGARSRIAYDHYSLLRTVEDAFGLPHLRGAACPCTQPLSGLLR